jgi:HAD superfamily hydrolase (TIGR01509 family)
MRRVAGDPWGPMNDLAVTFDFHNTLASCPDWFNLEVKHLPSSFLRWRSARNGAAVSPETMEQVDERYRQLRREIIEHGNELTAEACLEHVFNTMDLHVSEADRVAGVEFLMRELLPGASPIPGAIETVRTLHDLGIPIGVVSSAVYHPFLEWTLDAFGILDAMETVITSASAGFYKSRPELYLHAAQTIGVEPTRMVHVGDSLRFDVGGARRAGLGTVWLRHDHAETTEHAYVPDLTLHTLHGSAPEILDLLLTRSSSAAPHNSRADV